MRQAALNVSAQVCKIVYKEEPLKLLLKLLENNFLTSSSWRMRKITIYDTVTLMLANWSYKNCFPISSLKQILFDSNAEVRNAAGYSICYVYWYLSEPEMVAEFNELKAIAEENKKKTDAASKIKLHGSMIGIAAIIRAHNCQMKPWFTKVLTYFCKFKNNYGIASETVKVCLSDFWKRHR